LHRSVSLKTRWRNMIGQATRRGWARRWAPGRPWTAWPSRGA
jgi:hypothetical protein